MTVPAGRILVAVAALGAMACAGNEAETESDVSAAAAEGDSVRPETVTGRVRVVGNVPFTYTVIDRGEDEDGVRVLGIYESELSRLSGVRVRAVGQATSAGGQGPGSGLRVADYRILSVGGAEPGVGMLLQTPDGRYYLYSREGESTLLTGVSSGLRDLVGAKIWVVTSEEGSVQRYGVIREP